MGDRNTSTTTNDNLLESFFEKRALVVLDNEVGFYALAEKYPLPQGSGTQMTWNSWRRLAAASSTLPEASGNAAITLSSRKVNVSIGSYGRAVKATELLRLTSILDVDQGALERIQACATDTVDNVIQMAVFKNDITQVGRDNSAGTVLLSVWMSSKASAFCANTSTASYNANSNLQFGFPAVFGASVGTLSAVSKTAPSISARMGPIAVRRAVTQLRRLAAPTFADGFYAAVIHPNAWATMQGNPDWKQWHINFAGGPQESMYKHEVGQVHRVRFIESQNAPRYAVTAHSVNATAILGKGALGCTELDGGVKYIITRPGPQSTSDPFNLNTNIAFKVRMGAKVLNPSCGRILFTHELV